MDDICLLDVLDVVAAVVAARLAGVCACFTKHAARQIPVVADVDHLVAFAAASLEIFSHVGTSNATHQVLDASLPLEAADGECLEVHVVDDGFAEVAAVVAVVVGVGHEVHTANVVFDLSDALLDLVARHIDVFLRGGKNTFYSFQKKAFQFF